MGSAPTSEARPQWRTVRAAFPHTVPTLGIHGNYVLP